MGFFGKFRFWGRNPLTIVECIIAIFSIVGGLYVLSPILQYSIATNGASPVIALISHPIGIFLYGVAYIVSGILICIGIGKRRYQLRSTGLFINILTRSYGLLGTLLIQGLLPLTWLNTLIVLMVALICYVVVRGIIVRGIR